MADGDVDAVLRDFAARKTFGVRLDPEMFELRLANDRAAENLVTKARRLWHDDHQRALEYVRRALRVPPNVPDDTIPAVKAAHMMVFMAVVNDLEGSGPADTAWLEAALAVIESGPAKVQAVVRSVVKDIDQDYDLASAAHRQIGAVLRSGPVGQPWDLGADDAFDYVVAAVEAGLAYAAAIETLREYRDL